MNEILDRPGAIVPTEQDSELASVASRALARSSKDTLTVRLESGEELLLPKAVTQLLSHLLTEMGQGNAVTMIPIHAELTTQEAADFLNVSRPYLVRLLKEQKIPHHMVGTHRRVRFADLMAYKAEFDEQRRSTMDELAAQSQSLGMGY